MSRPLSGARFGLTEAEVRHRLEEQLVSSMRVEGDAPTVHAIAHALARIIEEDHLRMASQLEEAGVRLAEGSSG
ncbi:MAG: hypothetical protein ACE5EV_02435 [Gaiellales bacterium]